MKPDGEKLDDYRDEIREQLKLIAETRRLNQVALRDARRARRRSAEALRRSEAVAEDVRRTMRRAGYLF